ncbi:MAG: sigma-70 family RNA polymerase sigma factor [Actinobacteria bacterium]|nr:sigma-70 family RNA polymerase sigma factor [Actinomycetota bacterium]
MGDERLARWAAKGSQPAFAVIFERHHQALHRYCQSIVGNGHDAADALQNTMLKALRALPGETRTIALKPWLYRIAHNESISLLRSRRGHSDLDAAAHVGDPGAETIVESRERLRDLTADLSELTDQQRGTLLMRELAGLQFDEISAALQLTATAAKQSVYEARCALQSLEEGRAMDCDVIRHTLSDGDRRTLRNLKIRGHLRACAGCRDFEAALRQRPAHLAALTPALPLATAASILQGLLGTGTGHGGGGLLAAVGVGATSTGGTSLATKVATVAVIAGSAGGGAIYIAPDKPAQLADSPRVTQRVAPAAPGTEATPGTRAQHDRQRATRESASIKPTPEDSAATRAENQTTATQTQRPSLHAAPSPAAAARPAPPAPDAAPSDDQQTVPKVAADATARRPSESAAPPAPAAYAPPARPAAGTASEAAPGTLPPAAPTAGAPTTIAAAAARAAPVAPVAVIPSRPG